MCSPLRRFPLLPQVGKKSWHSVPRDAEWRPWATCGVRGCLGHPSTPGKSICAPSELSSRALWLAGWCSNPFAGAARRRLAGLEPRPGRADTEQWSCGGAGSSTRQLGRLAELLGWCFAQLGGSGESFLPLWPPHHTQPGSSCCSAPPPTSSTLRPVFSARATGLTCLCVVWWSVAVAGHRMQRQVSRGSGGG